MNARELLLAVAEQNDIDRQIDLIFEWVDERCRASAWHDIVDMLHVFKQPWVKEDVDVAVLCSSGWCAQHVQPFRPVFADWMRANLPDTCGEGERLSQAIENLLGM